MADLDTQDLSSQVSPLAALGNQNPPTDDDTDIAGASPLTNILLKRSQQYAPDQNDVADKRQGLLSAYQNLIQAQRNRAPAVNNPGDVAFASQMLNSSGNPELMGLGRGLAAETETRQGIADRAAQAEQQQAMTGLEAQKANLGFSGADQATSLDALKEAVTANNSDQMMKMRMALATIGKNTLGKDQNGNPIVFNKVTGTVNGANGNTNVAPVGGTTPAGAPVVKIPGLDPSSPATAGISQIIADTGLDPAGVSNRTRADISQATKDSQSDLALYNAAQNASKIANEAEKAIKGGYQGGLLGDIASKINANLPEDQQPQWVQNRDYLNKLSGQISSSLATQLHGARIGVGMEKFLKGTTFNTDIAQGANLQIVNDLKNLPYVAKANMDLGSHVNQLPENYKNAVYSEFIKDNPPFMTDDKGNYDLNPAYKSPTIVDDWFAKRAGIAPTGTKTDDTVAKEVAPPSGFTSEEWDQLTPDEKAMLKK